MEKVTRGSGKAAWDIARKKLLAHGQKRIIIADADLTRATLFGFDLSRCYVVRVNFTDAELGSSNLRQAIFHDSNFYRAYLYQADLTLADLRTCDLNIATPASELRGVRPWLADKIQLIQYRTDYDIDNKSWWLQQWFWLTHYGSSLRALGYGSLGTLALFTLIFYIEKKSLGEDITGPSEGIFELFAFSTMNFLNSGPAITSKNEIVIATVLLNVSAGVVALGIFIAVIARKLTVLR